MARTRNPEQALKNACLAILRAYPQLLWWVNFTGPVLKAGGVRGKNPNKGMPDLTIIKPQTGQLVFVEFKAERQGKLSVDQYEWQRRCEAVNVPVYVCDTVEKFEGAVAYALYEVS